MSHRKRIPDDAAIPAPLDTALLEEVAPVAPPAGLRARVLARTAVADFRTLRETEGWRAMAPGVEFKLLGWDERTDRKSFLLRAKPGIALPAHAHAADEECLVLEGEFSMGDLTLRAGDYHFAPRGSRHPDAVTRTGVLVQLRSCLRDYPTVIPARSPGVADATGP